MSDHAINLIKAIESGDQEQMKSAFNDAMSAKMSETLQARKIEIANNIYNGATQQDTEASDDDGSEEV